MAHPFHSAEDTHMRLNGTIAFYKGKPVMVAVQDGMQEDKDKISVRTLNGRKWATIKVTDPEFSYDAPKLGYVNMGTDTVWVARASVRQQKAGLPRAGLYLSSCFLENIPYRAEHVHDTKNLEAALLDNYPSFDESLQKIIDREVNSIAFNREFALGWQNNRNIMLAVRNRTVGVYDPDERRVILFNAPDTSFIYRTLDNLNLGVPL